MEVKLAKAYYKCTEKEIEQLYFKVYERLYKTGALYQRNKRAIKRARKEEKIFTILNGLLSITSVITLVVLTGIIK